MHRKKNTNGLSNPSDWSTVKFIEGEGDRYLSEMDKDLAEIEKEL